MPKSRTRGFVTRSEVKVERMPWGPYEWLTRADIVDTEQLLVARVQLRKGQGHGFHRHPSMEEVIYVLDGKAEQWIGDEMRVLGTGDVAHVARDVVHATFNHGNGILRYLMVMGPAKFQGPALVDASSEEPWVSIRDQRRIAAKRKSASRRSSRSKRSEGARLASGEQASRRKRPKRPG
ncbi:MAG: cupin domain-containing protein [Planctomycetota bacterium]|nr:cupin domain-containing protein [Planctomycetota bacterium]